MKKIRFPGLDGLRGLAILAVILTHIPLGIWYGSVPQFFHPFLNIILGSGGVGVTIFFLLTGFLMGLLYPNPKSNLSFYVRRYARLFPPFLVMVFSFTIFKLYKIQSPPEQILIVIGGIMVMRILWEIVIRVSPCMKLGRKLILVGLAVQGSVALWYVFYLLNIPPSVFYEVWSPAVQTIITGIVNATLTLPFGQYIAQLDGIYWALCMEVLFYLLYPVWFVPIVHYLRRSSYRWKFGLSILTIIALIPFSYGLYLIGLRFLGFEMLKLHLVIYLIMGVVIGANLDWFQAKAARFQKLIAHPLWFLLLLCIVFGQVELNQFIPKLYHPLLQIIMVFPLSLLLLSAVTEKTSCRKWLGGRIFTLLATFSYSLFLVHSFVIHIGQKLIPTVTSLDGVLLVVFSLTGSVIFAVVLYYLTEYPYFSFRKRSSAVSKDAVVAQKDLKHATGLYFYKTYVRKVASAGIVLFILLYLAFKPPLSIFTIAYRHGNPPFWSVLDEKPIVLGEEPFVQSFIAKEDNLGMITTHIRNQAISGVEGGFVPSLLIERLRNDKNEVIKETSFRAYEIIDSVYHPFGFPVEANSKGKTYTIEYQLSKMSPSQEIELIPTENMFISVYFVDKKNLVHPDQFLSWMMSKLEEPFTTPVYWFTFAQIIPLFALLVIAKKPNS